MRTKFLVLVAALVGSALAIAQTATTEKGGVSVQTQPGKRTFMIRHEMGKWWKDSQVAQKLQLNDGQSVVEQFSDATPQKVASADDQSGQKTETISVGAQQ